MENSHFMAGPTASSSCLAEFPNGGRVMLEGSLFHSGPTVDSPPATSFDAEGLSNASPPAGAGAQHGGDHALGGFFNIASGASSVTCTANLFAGTGNQSLVTGGYATGNVVQASNVTSLASNIPGATSIASPNFWPNATLQAQIGLTGVPDAGYTRDAPVPYMLRPLTGSARKAGALQSAP